jgi:O-antigen/teichoic acid export membrane protein
MRDGGCGNDRGGGRMSRVARNITANLIGRGWTTALAVLFIPIYLRFLGVEAYGLIGFLATLQGVFSLLDMGLSTTLNREMARLSSLPGRRRRQRDLLRTLEVIYWGVSLTVGAIVVLLAYPIAARWVNTDQLSLETVVTAIRLMGLIIALQLPFSFYQGGLMGLQRQVHVNAILIGTGTLRSGGAALILWQVAPTLEAFFFWHVVVSLFQAALTAVVVWRELGGPAMRPRFRWPLAKGVSSFAGHISANAIVGAFLTQADKVVLSRLLSLTDFGYYVLAGTVASFVWAVSVPINAATFPRFSQLNEMGDDRNLASLYHRTTQLMVVAIFPAALTVAFFAPDLVYLWTRDSTISDSAALLVSLLVVGTALNALVGVPAYLQAAVGWPQLMLYTNVCAAVVLIPGIAVLATLFGPVGAAFVWIALNVGYLLFMLPVMHRRLLPNELGRWIRVDVAVPIAGAASVALLGWRFAPTDAYPLVRVGYIFLVWLIAVSVAAALAPEIRSYVLRRRARSSLKSALRPHRW